jgi:hypothetical protein
MADAPLTYSSSPAGGTVRHGLLGAARAATIAVASLALGAAAVLGLLFAGIALA